MAAILVLAGPYLLFSSFTHHDTMPQHVYAIVIALLTAPAGVLAFRAIPEQEEGVRRKPNTLLFTLLFLTIFLASFFHPSDSVR
jgi:H+/Cl- antiporter ClcA